MGIHNQVWPNSPGEFGAPKCPENLAYVPAGNRRGLNGMVTMHRHAPDGGISSPGRSICPNVPKAPVGAFCMDVYEVSVAEYQGCVDKGACPTPNACYSNKLWGSDTSEVCAGSAGAENAHGLCACRQRADGPCQTRRETRDISAHGIHDLGANALEWISGGLVSGRRLVVSVMAAKRLGHFRNLPASRRQGLLRNSMRRRSIAHWA
jgi:hypothetical protein